LECKARGCVHNNVSFVPTGQNFPISLYYPASTSSWALGSVFKIDLISNWSTLVKLDFQVLANSKPIWTNSSFVDAESDWSEIQTIDLATSNSIGPSPTVPEFSVVTFLALAVIPITVLLIKRKRIWKGNML